jgi:hypothetical protein
VTSEQTLLSNQAAQFVFATQRLGRYSRRHRWRNTAELVDQAEDIPDDRRALFLRLRPALTTEAHIEEVIAVLAETATRLSPVWFTDVSFAMCCDDALGRRAAGVIAREAAARVSSISSTWAEAAIRLVLPDARRAWLAFCPPSRCVRHQKSPRRRNG